MIPLHRTRMSVAAGAMTRRTALARMGGGALLAAAPCAHAAADEGDAAQIVVAAEATVQAFATDPDFASLRAALPRAKGVLIFPEVLRAGFLLGGSGGNGVLMVRDARSGAWLGPAFYTIGSASLGLQVGASTAQMLMLVNNEKALDTLYGSRLELGADASAAIGSQGVEKAVGVNTDITVYARVKGVFAGVAFDGAVLDARESLNKAFYERDASPVDILLRHTVRSAGGDGLRAKLTQLSG
jgi:lipid-binding SYLF domain-containing protein